MTQLLRLRLLGGASLELDGKPLTGMPSRAAEALLIYLACEKRPVSREALAELLWAERSQQQALTNLRTVLSALRRELGAHLLISRETLAFDQQANFWLDSDEFERRMAALSGVLRSGSPLDEAAAASLHEALALYRGDFLAGFSLREGPGFEEWAILEQERLRRLAHSGLRRLARHGLEAGSYPAGVEIARKLLALDPYDEEALQLLMWRLARNGQRNAALAQYETTRRMLAATLQVEPSAETRKVFERLRALSFPPPHNLPAQPAQPAAFIGREEELAEINARLAQPGCRLLTLLGPGGGGKTRLCLEAARRVVEGRPGQFLDGVFFAPLETLENAQDLALRVGGTLGVAFQGGEPLRAQLLRWLREKELLLILDNFEHLLAGESDAPGLLAGILAQAPGVKLLVTSRQRLDLVEEWIFDVHGLALPQPGQTDPLSASAPQLFWQVAQRLQRQFSANEEIASIVEICRLLDGLPLAIELAAGWSRQYTCAQIAVQIQGNLDFLHATQRNAAERQRSLRAVFDHSWRLLNGEEQSTLAQLSALRGDFSPAAASAVLDCDAHPMLAFFADRSLLQRSGGERYAMHPALRPYAAERLAENRGAQEIASRRHAAYFLRWLAEQGNGETPQARAAIRGELTNLRPAWEWAARQKESGWLERAAPALHNFYSAESWFVEGIAAFDTALQGLGEASADDAPVVCDLLGRRARMQIHIGQLNAARAGLEQAYALLERVPQGERRAAILGYLAITHYYTGDYGRAAELAGHALEISRAGGDLGGAATALNFLGSCHKARGDYAAAQRHFEQAAAIYRQLHDPLGEAMVLNNLGNLAQAGGAFENARQLYMQASALFKAQEHSHGAATMLSNAGLLAFRLGSHAEARSLLEESLALKQKIGDRRGIATALALLGDVAAAEGDYPAARAQLFEALEIAYALGDIKLCLDTLAALAVWAARTGQRTQAARWLAFVGAQAAASQEARQRAGGAWAELKIEAERKAAEGWVEGKTLEDVVRGILPGETV